jgi:hypothetical protein
MKMQTYGTTIVASDIDITEEALEEATIKMCDMVDNLTYRDLFVDVLGGKPSWEVEVDFNE